jgi:hypothetical protein
VVGEGLQRRVRHGVDRERRGKPVHVQRVGGRGVLGAGAGPQQPLHPPAGVLQALHAVGVHELPVCPVGVEPDGEAELVLQLLRHAAGDRDIPAGHEDRGDRANRGLELTLEPALDARQVRVGGGPVLVGREQQGDVHGHAGGDALGDRRQTLGRPGDLDEQVGSRDPRVQ